MAKVYPANFLAIAQELLSYNPDTGVFVWKALLSTAKRKPGERAGTLLKSTGYRSIGLSTHRVLEHRLAWLMHYGCWPSGIIDHINGNPSDNRIANLRECNHAQNQYNRTVHYPGPSGRRGVFKNGSDPGWRACICINGRNKYLGTFATIEEAAAAREKAAKELHGEFYRP